jgi:aminomethyltransferase
VAALPAMISRTGYTGEDGFEIFVPSERAEEVWDAILAAGAAHDVKPCGLGARDVCRLEAGLRLYGNDMDASTDPYQAGLGWTVKLGKKTAFVGQPALAAIKERGPDRMLVGLKCRERVIPRHDIPVLVHGTPVGRVTSGTFSFWLNQGIAMASMPLPMTQAGQEVAFEIRGQEGTAEVTRLPFYRGSVRTPAASKA